MLIAGALAQHDWPPQHLFGHQPPPYPPKPAQQAYPQPPPYPNQNQYKQPPYGQQAEHGYCDTRSPPKCLRNANQTYCLKDTEYPEKEIQVNSQDTKIHAL